MYIMFLYILWWWWFKLIETNAYSFCPNCLHQCPKKTDQCDLFRTHPLFKDRPDVDIIGKEICGEKGKYFISGRTNSSRHVVYEQNTNIFKGKFIKKTK